VILHGDLWSGNKGMALNRPGVEEASPAVFDPAAYFGHNEADLGIMHMFGGTSLRLEIRKRVVNGTTAM
jgi:fructosamine-3-kinase